MRPSFLGLLASGLLILFAFILVIVFNSSISADKGIMITLMFAIAISGHSQLHSIEERVYGFNPLAGQWFPREAPRDTPREASLVKEKDTLML